MNFQQAQQEYQRLKASYEKGAISPEQFERAVLNLRLVDREGQAWHIGLTSGAWYRKQGTGWVEDTPTIAGAGLRAEHTFFGAPTWLALAIGGAGVVTVLGVFAISMFFLLNSGAFPAARVITATPGPSHTPGFTRTVDDMGMATLTPAPRQTRSEDDASRTTSSPGDTEITETISPDSTQDPLIRTSQPTGANLPVVTPTRTRTPVPIPVDVAIRVWKSFSHSSFENADAIQSEWQSVMEPDESYRFDFLNYKNRSSMLVTASYTILDVSSDDDASYDQPLDIEIEEILAFPPNNNSDSLDFSCRNSDWVNYYNLNISRTEWILEKYQEYDANVLEQGSTPSGFQNGDWGRITMRCNGNQISVWLNGVLLTNVEDNDYTIGSWAMTIYMDLEEETSLYFASHHVFKGTEDQVGEVLDRYQLGDLYATVDRGLRKEGDVYSLGLSLENRVAESKEIMANQVYLLAPDGSRYPAAIDPPQNITLPPLRFPLTLDKQQLAAGSVYFRGLNADTVDSGLQLVVDLSDLGYGQALFQIPAP